MMRREKSIVELLGPKGTRIQEEPLIFALTVSRLDKKLLESASFQVVRICATPSEQTLQL